MSDVFEVEAVVDYRPNPHEYMVKWKGYPDSENSWCALSEMSCHNLIKDYWQSQRKKCPHRLYVPAQFKRIAERESSDSSTSEESEPQEACSSKSKSHRRRRVAISSSDEEEEMPKEEPKGQNNPTGKENLMDVANLAMELPPVEPTSDPDSSPPRNGDSRESSPFPELFPKGVPLHPLVAPPTRFYPYRTVDSIITKHKRAFDERSIGDGNFFERHKVIMKRKTKPIDEMTEEELEADIRFFEEQEEEEKKIWFPACEAEIAKLNGFERGAQLKRFLRLELETDKKTSGVIYYAILEFLDKGQLVEEKIDTDYLKCNYPEVIGDYLERSAIQSRAAKYAEYGIDNFEAWKSERIAQGKKLC